MMNVAILGASGYTALELIQILLRHPEVQITTLTSRQADGQSIAEIHPVLTGRIDLKCENLKPTEIAAREIDVVFCCLPHTASMEAVPELLLADCKVIDLSADYRLNSPGVYEQWYGHVHTDPTRLGSTVYGLPELPFLKKQIPNAELIANPGCYTSTSILALAPLLAEQLIEPTDIIIDAKSGLSGAGRSPKLGTLFAECNESVSAYGVGTHRHTPEINQILSQAAQTQIEVVFTPHLMPMDRGIFGTVYCKPTDPAATADDLLAAMRGYYQQAPFIRVVEHLPNTKAVSHTNYCDLTVRKSGEWLLVLACLDNLIKGAAGVAVQNFNLMHGFAETTALLV